MCFLEDGIESKANIYQVPPMYGVLGYLHSMLDKGVGIKDLPNYFTLRFTQPNMAKSLRLKLLR